MIDNRGRAFGVRGDRCAGILLFQLEQLCLAKRLVHNANAWPQQHFAIKLAAEIAAQVAVRPEDDLLVARDLLQDRFRAGTGGRITSDNAFTSVLQLM